MDFTDITTDPTDIGFSANADDIADASMLDDTAIALPTGNTTKSSDNDDISMSDMHTGVFNTFSDVFNQDNDNIDTVTDNMLNAVTTVNARRTPA